MSVKTFVIVCVGVTIAIVFGRPGAFQISSHLVTIIILGTLIATQISKGSVKLSCSDCRMDLLKVEELLCQSASCVQSDSNSTFEDGSFLAAQNEQCPEAGEIFLYDDNAAATDRSTPLPTAQIGLLVTDGLDSALKRCKAKVERITKDCRKGNRKFR